MRIRNSVFSIIFKVTKAAKKITKSLFTLTNGLKSSTEKTIFFAQTKKILLQIKLSIHVSILKSVFINDVVFDKNWTVCLPFLN
jgi:hypothetical protein